MPKIFLIVFVCIVAFSEDLSFLNAYNMLLENNHIIKAKESAIQKANKQVSATNMLWLPDISVSYNYIQLAENIELQLLSNADASKLNMANALSGGNPAISGLIQGLSKPINLTDKSIVLGALNIKYPIFVGGRRIFASKIADLGIKDAILELEFQKLLKFEDLAKAYYGVILNEQVLSTLQNVELSATTHLQNANKLQEVGMIAKIEVLQAEVSLENAKNNTKTARDNLDISLLYLNSLLQKAYDSKELNSQISLDMELPNFEQLKIGMTRSYPTLQMLENKKSEVSYAKKMLFATFLPTLALHGSYQYQNDVLQVGNTPNWYVGVQAKWDILSSTGRLAKYQMANLAKIEINHTASQAKNDMDLLLSKTYKEATNAYNKAKSLDTQINLGKENLLLKTQAFKQGLSTSLDVSNANDSLALSIISKQKAIFEYSIALAKLSALSGDVNVFINYNIEPQIEPKLENNTSSTDNEEYINIQ